MSELDLLREAGRALDPPAGPPDALRQRVLNGFTASRSSRRRWRPRLSLAVAAGLAVALLLTAALVAGADRSRQFLVSPRPSGTPSGTPSPLPSLVLGAPEAQQFLRAVAAAASDEVSPRPDQYIYVDAISVRMGQPESSEYWSSVDGTRASYTRGRLTAYFVGCKDGVSVRADGQPEPHMPGRCTPNPGFRNDLPTTVEGMRQLIASKGLTQLMLEIFLQPKPTLLPRATEAVLFEALAESPVATLVQPVVDAAGRQGVAVTWNHAGSTLRLVFDPSTHEYRAIQIINPGQTTPEMEDCVVRYEIVDVLPGTN